jgi:hypothetical protein
MQLRYPIDAFVKIKENRARRRRKLIDEREDAHRRIDNDFAADRNSNIT